MKRGLLLFVFLCAVVSMQAQKKISYIETTKNWYYIYDESGKKIGGLSRSSVGEVKGWGNDFFVAKYYSFYRIYDAKGKVLKAMNVSDVGEIVGVSGNTITSRRGSWIITWDKDGKKISSRSV